MVPVTVTAVGFGGQRSRLETVVAPAVTARKSHRGRLLVEQRKCNENDNDLHLYIFRANTWLEQTK